MKFRFSPLFLIIAVLLILPAASAILFDDFTGVNGTDWNTAKWDVHYTVGTTTATIQTNQGQETATRGGTDALRRMASDINFVLTTGLTLDINFQMISCSSTGGQRVAVFGLADWNAVSNIPGLIEFSCSTAVDKGVLINGASVHVQETAGTTDRLTVSKVNDNTLRLNAWIDGSQVVSNYDVTTTKTIFKISAFIQTYNATSGNQSIMTVDNVYYGASFFVLADFNQNPSPPYILDPENSITSIGIDFNDISSYPAGENWQASTWDINSTTVSLDQNLHFEFTNANDFNVFVNVRDTADNNSTDYSIVKVLMYPQDLNFTWSPANPSISEDVNFYGTTSMDANIVAWSFGSTAFEDGNVFGTDGNFTVRFTSSGTQQVCMQVQNKWDLNRSFCQDVNVELFFKATFWDENSETKIRPQVFLNDTNYSSYVDANGEMTLNLSGITPGTYILSAYTDTHPVRYFKFDINGLTSIDVNLALLPQTFGTQVTFQFYAPDQSTILSDANLFIKYYTRNWYASIIQLDGSGMGTIFLRDWDVNYQFDLYSGANNYKYYGTALKIKIPKSESTGDNITPYKVHVSGLGSQDYNNITYDINALILSDTEDYYDLEIQDVVENYYERIYSVRTTGGQASYILQPYLVSSTELSSLVYVINESGGQSVENVLVVIKKNVPGVGLVTVQSIATDGSGLALVNWIQNETYIVELYYQNKFQFSTNIRPNSTIYYFYLALINEGTSIFEIDIITASFLPSSKSLDINTDINAPNYNDADFNIQIRSVKGTIQSINIKIFQGSDYKVDQNYGANVSFGTIIYQTVDLNGWTRLRPIQVLATVTYEGGTFMVGTEYYAPGLGIPSGKRPTDIVGDLTQTGEDAGPVGRAIIIALVLAMISGSVIKVTGKIQPADMVGVFVIVLPFFGYIGWLDIGMVFLLEIVLIGGYIFADTRG